MRSSPVLIVLALLAPLFASACSGCDDGGVIGTPSGGDSDTGCTGPSCVDAGGNGGNSDGGPSTGDTDGTDAGPSCPAARVCASACCGDGELCIADSCVTPGAACETNFDCGTDEVCEPTLARCIPDPGVDCTYQPVFNEFDPTVTMAWRGEDTTPAPEYNQVMMTPSVADINADGIPDVVFSTFTGSAYNEESVLRAFDGRTYAPIFDLVEGGHRVSGSASVAIGDIDGDLQNEIIAVAPGGAGLIAFDDHRTSWDVLWTTAAFPMNWDGAYLTDLNGDGVVEVVAGTRVFDGGSGDLLCENLDAGNSAFNSSAADLDGDGILEVVTGALAFRFVDNGDGTYSCPTYFPINNVGFPAVGDFGSFDGDTPLFGVPDGKPEIVTVSSSGVELINGQTGAVIWTAAVPNDNHPHFTVAECGGTGGGPPTIADFDGDGEPEVATAGSCFYAVFETDGSLLWKHPSQDFSSRITGSSVFDFQGDGKAEAVYADECFIRVYDGAGNGDGTTNVLFKRTHTSGTTRELPVIVDVDRDYHAEIVLISNDYSGVGTRCSATWPDFDALGGPERGVLIVEDPLNEWVSTRPIWNQHAYHVTNVCDGVDDTLCPGAAQNVAGVIPPVQAANWSLPHLNNFRQNVQGAGLFNAPDLIVSDIDRTCNLDDSLTIGVTVANQGARGVIAGVPVTIWFTMSGTEQLVTTLHTTTDLPPGGRETLTYVWTGAPHIAASDTFSLRAVVDDDGTGGSTLNECIEDNNTLTFEGMCRCQTDDDCDVNEFCSMGMCIEYPQ